jgi:hypothetical protein
MPGEEIACGIEHGGAVGGGGFGALSRIVGAALLR